LARALALLTCFATICLSTPYATGQEGAEKSCEGCHEPQAQEFSRSVHHIGNILCRSCHLRRHGTSVEMGTIPSRNPTTAPATQPSEQAEFDHGPDFLGKPSRFVIPELCGSCHSDVMMMNPYGLPTDQLSQYRFSGHGKALYEQHNDRVAVCIDCHGVHEILAPSDPASTVYPRNVPHTCGKCHADASVMQGSNLPVTIVSQYLSSVHGKGLIEKGDTAMPHCASCHGSHSAVPPGYQQVGHVCGKCHQREEENFQKSIHGQFPFYPRCISCHSPTADLRNHAISRIAARPEAVQKVYAEVVASLPAGADDAVLQQAYAARRVPHIPPIQQLCHRCHNADRQTGHRLFFARVDEAAAETGERTYHLLLGAELRFAAVARRVDDTAHGILIVDDEQLMVEQLRTQLVALGPTLHRMDVSHFTEATDAIGEGAEHIDASLDVKLDSLRWRYRALLPIWVFVAFFIGALWIKYQRLKAVWVRHDTSKEGESS
jgi:hypothetical protein